MVWPWLRSVKCESVVGARGPRSRATGAATCKWTTTRAALLTNGGCLTLARPVSSYSSCTMVHSTAAAQKWRMHVYPAVSSGAKAGSSKTCKSATSAAVATHARSPAAHSTAPARSPAIGPPRGPAIGPPRGPAIGPPRGFEERGPYTGPCERPSAASRTQTFSPGRATRTWRGSDTPTHTPATCKRKANAKHTQSKRKT
jgi:hypothetical protein